MPSYRFCRSDDIPRLVEAYNRCWLASFPDAEPLDEAGLKRWIREEQLWTSSCMLAVEGSEPVAVLLGCKRDDATRIHRLAVHPEHRRLGHGGHLLTSLSSKLAILGPPLLVAELPDDREDLAAFFRACGWEAGPRSADWSRPPGDGETGAPAGMVIPFTVDDLLANDAFETGPERAWGRDLPALEARRDRLEGLAVATFEGIEATWLCDPGDPPRLLSFGTAERGVADRGAADGGSAEAAFRSLLAAWTQHHGPALEVPRVHESEIPAAWLESTGFHRGRSWTSWSAEAEPA